MPSPISSSHALSSGPTSSDLEQCPHVVRFTVAVIRTVTILFFVMATMKETNYYEVRFTITVDKPELRGPTYPVVPAGKKIPTTWTYASYTAAVNEYAAILRGEWDFSSEYVSSVAVYKIPPASRYVTIRKNVMRKRGSKTTAASIAAWSKNLMTKNLEAA